MVPRYGPLRLTGNGSTRCPPPPRAAVGHPPLTTTFTRRQTGFSLPGIPNLAPVRELAGGPARPPRWRSHLRSNPKNGLKLHNGLASAGRSAVL